MVLATLLSLLWQPPGFRRRQDKPVHITGALSSAGPAKHADVEASTSGISVSDARTSPELAAPYVPVSILPTTRPAAAQLPETSVVPEKRAAVLLIGAMRALVWPAVCTNIKKLGCR